VDLLCSDDPKAAVSGRPTPLFYRHEATCQTTVNLGPSRPEWLKVLPYSSFAVIVIFAFNTFDTGHPFSAASAYF
jgi:hypothetical protein